MSNSLKQIKEQTPIEHNTLNARELEEWRTIIRENQRAAKRALFVIPLFVILGVCFLVLAAKIWLFDLQRSLPAGFAFTVGISLGVLVLGWLKPNMGPSYKNLKSTDLSQEDVLSYFREYQEMLQRSVRQWKHIGRYVFLAAAVLLIIGQSYAPTRLLTKIVLFSGVGVPCLWIVVFAVQRARDISNANSKRQ